MIVDTLLNEFTWGPNVITCADKYKLYIAYNFLREAVMDSHIYITKVVGFYVKNKTLRNHSGTYIARNTQIGESYVELMTKLSDKVICNSTRSELQINAKRGILRVEEIEVVNNERLLSVNDEICHVVDGNIVLNLKLRTDCGYRDMQQNSAMLSSEYFPMNTYFNLCDYIRVLPMIYGEQKIDLRFYNGFDMPMLRDILVKYSYMIRQELVNEEELKWVLNFEL